MLSVDNCAAWLSDRMQKRNTLSSLIKMTAEKTRSGMEVMPPCWLCGSDEAWWCQWYWFYEACCWNDS